MSLGRISVATIAALTGAAITTLNTPQPVAAAVTSAPLGSYQKTCDIISVDEEKKTLTVLCKRKAEHKHWLNRDWKFKYCTGDISNEDGYLHCKINQEAVELDKMKAAQAAAEADQQAKNDAADAAQKAKDDAAKAAADAAIKAQETKQFEAASAKAAFDTASILVLGRYPSTKEVADWVPLMKTPDYGFSAQITAGTADFTDVTKFLKAYIAKPGGASLRSEAIDNAFKEVYGRASTPTEQAVWDSQIRAGKAWYAPIVLGEQSKFMANDAEHAATVERAFLIVFGRRPTTAEVAQFKARPEHFRQIVSVERGYLYSAAGAGELIATISRAMAAKGQKPTDASIKAAMVGYVDKKATYADMVRPIVIGR